jgi:UDP-2,4-diacetamido-2,4,6-trideoxy-beta-L-altropyranose hydrolase
MMMQVLIIRADANAQMGTGHLMRCLALAQAWKAQGGQAIFITACDSNALRQRLLDEDFQVVIVERPYPDPGDWEQTSRVLAAYPGAWVVLDGYHFDADYQRRIKEAGHQLLVIDDMAHLDRYHADIVLNQNIHAEQLQYSCEPYTRLLLGTKYVLLRTEFLKWRGWRREIPEVARKILVTLGGGDPDNVTLKVIRALQQVDVDGVEAGVVVGANNPHYEELQFAVQDSRMPIRVESNVTNMPELMAWADIAVSAGGSTVWELAFMGLPAVVLELAKNQHDIAVALDKAGAALGLGWYTRISIAQITNSLSRLLEDRSSRFQMSQYGRVLVDGMGPDRVIKYLRRSHSNQTDT